MTEEKAKSEAHAFLAFALSGGVAAGVNLVSRYVLSMWLFFEGAITIAYLIGMTTAFVLTRTFVFRRSNAHWLLEYGRFALVNMVAFVQVLLVSECFVRFVFPATGMIWHPEEIGHLIGVISPILTSYYAHKHFSFRSATALEPNP